MRNVRLMKKQLKSHGLKKDMFKIDDEVIYYIIRHYTREAGVRDELLTDRIFLSKPFYWPQIYDHSEFIRATRYYICQEFWHSAKICRLNVKCGNCIQSHQTSECNQPENRECANCEKPHASNSGDCPVYLITLKKIYESRNIVLPQNFN